MAKGGLSPVGQSRIAAIVLAAGGAARMGSPKPLTELDGRTLLSWVLGAIPRSAVGETIVVLGAWADEIRAGVDLTGCTVVENPEPAAGMSSSLRRGVAAVSATTEAFFVVLGDAPLVRPTTYHELIAARLRARVRIVVPLYAGLRGHPVLFDRSLSSEVDRITGDRGARALVLEHASETLEVPLEDPGVLIDLDTPGDLREAEDRLRSGASLVPLALRLASSGRPRERSSAGARLR